jgi:hypothetical protein
VQSPQLPLGLQLDQNLVFRTAATFRRRLGVEQLAGTSDRPRAVALFEREIPGALPLHRHFFQSISSPGGGKAYPLPPTPPRPPANTLVWIVFAALLLVLAIAMWRGWS